MIPTTEAATAVATLIKERDRLRVLVESDAADDTAIERECAKVLGQAFVDGDSYSVPGPVECVRKVVAELERVQDATDKEWLDAIGTAWMRVTGRHWDTLDGETREEGLSANIGRLFDELERVQKAAAQMRSILEKMQRNWAQGSSVCSVDAKIMNDALATDAGKGYVREAPAYEYAARLFKYRAPECTPLPDLMGVLTQLDNLLTGMVWKEDVKPLVAALEYYTNATRKESSHLPPHRTWQGDDGLTARKALTHAKTKGLA